MNLFYNNDIAIDNTYIITVKGNAKSEELAERCAKSCDKVGQKYKLWPAYDGTGDTLVAPDSLKQDSFMNLLKVTDHYMTRGEVACALSHISLWLECAKNDKPIVILEHDSIMVNKFEYVKSYNSIVYLGGAEWVKSGWKIYDIPPHASDGPNNHFICRAHAYAIDPTMAKNLLSHVLKMGICDPLDIMMRVDLFNVTHQGLYAYDDNLNTTNDTTIKKRPLSGRTTKRNDQLLD